MTSIDIFRDWRVGMIAGAALLHLTVFAGAWVMVPHDGVETRLDRPIEASLMPAPSNDMVNNDSAEIAKEVATLNEQGETAPEDTAEVVPPDAVMAEMVAPPPHPDVVPPKQTPSQDPVDTPTVPMPRQLATLAPEIVTTTSPDVVTSAPVIVPATEPAKIVPLRPEPEKPKPLKAEKLKPGKDVRKKSEPVVKPQPNQRTLAKLDDKTTKAKIQRGGEGAISDIGASSNATTSGATKQAYGAILVAQARARKRYPASAQARGATGEAKVGFVVTGQGTIGNVRLVKSTGEPDLDAAAVAVIRSLSPPPPPGGRFNTILPINYTRAK
ncbi:TonB family protein [Labrys neptuniae]